MPKANRSSSRSEHRHHPWLNAGNILPSGQKRTLQGSAHGKDLSEASISHWGDPRNDALAASERKGAFHTATIDHLTSMRVRIGGRFTVQRLCSGMYKVVGDNGNSGLLSKKNLMKFINPARLPTRLVFKGGKTRQNMYDGEISTSWLSVRILRLYFDHGSKYTDCRRGEFVHVRGTQKAKEEHERGLQTADLVPEDTEYLPPGQHAVQQRPRPAAAPAAASMVDQTDALRMLTASRSSLPSRRQRTESEVLHQLCHPEIVHPSTSSRAKQPPAKGLGARGQPKPALDFFKRNTWERVTYPRVYTKASKEAAARRSEQVMIGLDFGFAGEDAMEEEQVDPPLIHPPPPPPPPQMSWEDFVRLCHEDLTDDDE